jgi:UDP-N-acetylmuramate--alanine ligase
MRLAQSKVHFVGIGGIGMCGLAELLHNMGAKVSGSDQAENAQSQRLKELGIGVTVGHNPKLVHGVDVVVYSSAVKPSNVEFAEARKLKIPLIPRAEVLAEIMRLKRGVAVAGTHGKTTTTSMLASVFLKGELNPTIVVGGRLDLIKSTALLGTGDWLVAEADESDGSFSKLSPEIAIVTNIDNDHLDHYGSFENVQRAFLDFAGRIPFYGLLVACGDDPIVRKTFADFGKRVVYYGFEKDNDMVLRALGGGYEVLFNQKPIGRFELNLPGRHNALNAAASIVVGMEAGLSFGTCVQGLAQFRGVDRRFHLRGHYKGVPVFDDYGHHPTEVQAVLQAFREKYPESRLHVIFQPHRYSRTRDCWSKFTECFKLADHVYVYDIYAAGEPAISGITAERLASEIQSPRARHITERKSFLEELKTIANNKDRDVIVTLGAGDVWKDAVALVNADA